MKRVKLIGFIILIALFNISCANGVERVGEIQYIRNESKGNEEIYKKIKDIVIEEMYVDDVVELLGEPDEYTWDYVSYDYSILPSRYLMVYDDILNVHVLNNQIVEIQIFGDKFQSDEGLEIGMHDDLFEKITIFDEIKEGVELEYEEGVYYKNIRGVDGKSYYEYDNLRVHIYEGSIVSIYYTNPNLSLEEAMYVRVYGGFYNNLLWKDIYGISFLTDSRVLGKWICVDYVDTADGYDSNLQYNEDLVYSYIEFVDRRVEVTLNPEYSELQLQDYVLNGELFWSRGYIFNNKRKTAQEYFIYEVDGRQHLFIQDRGWNYSMYGVKPKYYVFTRLE